MLEHLFGSRTRVKLLSLFLRHPDEPLFVREITRRIDTQINAVRRELNNLVQFGLISEKQVLEDSSPAKDKKQPGLKKKHYQVNSSFVLLPELTALLIKAQVLLEKKLDREITKLGDVRYLSLSGMFLGKQNPSPVDMFIVGKVDKQALADLMESIERELGFDLNFSCMSSEEFEYRKDIADRFLTKILEAPKNVMVDRLNERAV